jgi:hypothetical protein
VATSFNNIGAVYGKFNFLALDKIESGILKKKKDARAQGKEWTKSKSLAFAYQEGAGWHTAVTEQVMMILLLFLQKQNLENIYKPLRCNQHYAPYARAAVYKAVHPNTWCQAHSGRIISHSEYTWPTSFLQEMRSNRNVEFKELECVLLLQDLLQSCSRGGGGEWRTCAMRDDEPRPVWINLPITH